MELQPPQLSELLISGVWFEWLVFIATIAVGCIPLYRNVRGMRGQDNSPINIDGRYIIISFLIIFLVGSMLIFFNKWKSLNDNYATDKRHLEDTIRISRIDNNLKHTQKTLYKIDSALTAQGYTVIDGEIIPPKININGNSNRVASAGPNSKIDQRDMKLEIKGDNNGIAKVGDGDLTIITSGSLSLTESGKKDVLNRVQKTIIEQGAFCCSIRNINGGHPIILNQIIELLQSNGYKNLDIGINTGVGLEVIEGIRIKRNDRDQVEISIGVL